MQEYLAMNKNLLILLQAQAQREVRTDNYGMAIGIILLFVGVGFLIYSSIKNRKVSFSIIGAISGIPLSYYFQNVLIQLRFSSISGYITNLDIVLNNGNMIGDVIMSVIIFAIVGGVIGFFVDNSSAKNKL